MIRRLLRSPLLISLASILALWQLLSFFTSPRILPSPLLVGISIWNIAMSGEALTHTGITMLRIIAGFLLAIILGLSIGIAMGINRYWELFLGDIIYVGITFPTLFWAVLGVLLFGFHTLTPVFTVILAATPFVAINVWQGVKATDRELIEMSRAFKVPKRKILREIIFPSLIPYLLAAIRYSFILSWKLVMISEIFSATEGIGFKIFQAFYSTFNVRQMLAWAIIFISIVFVIELLLMRRVERFYLRWRHE